MISAKSAIGFAAALVCVATLVAQAAWQNTQDGVFALACGWHPRPPSTAMDEGFINTTAPEEAARALREARS